MAWQVVLSVFCVLIMGGVSFVDPGMGGQGNAAADRESSEDGTDEPFDGSPSPAALVWKSASGDNTSFLRKNHIGLRRQAPIAESEVSNEANDSRFELCDIYDKALLRECWAWDSIRDDHMIARGYFNGDSVYRRKFRYEIAIGCDSFDGFVRIKRPGNHPILDENIACAEWGSGRTRGMIYCSNSSELITYHHQVLGNISTPVKRAATVCPTYCIGVYTPYTEVKLRTISWQIGSRCPEEINDECSQMNDSSVIPIGDNTFCFKSWMIGETNDHNLDPVIYSPAFHIPPGTYESVRYPLRKCGNFTNCQIGYCLRRKNESTRCGHIDRMFHIEDPHPDCLWETSDNSSLRISEEEWCCRNPDGCGTPVGKCSRSEDCYADYCIGIPDGNRNETRCPKGDNETGWKECADLKWRQTKWISERNAWCCIPEKNQGCDYKVRSCGSDISCRSNYCIAEKQSGSYRTSCPENGTEVEPCKNISEGQELIISFERVCCKKRNCLGNGTICGDDPVCGKPYCVAWKPQDSTELFTACPTDEEDRLLGSKCSALRNGGNAMVEGRKVWCCKKRYCSKENREDIFPRPGSISIISVPGDNLSIQRWPRTAEILLVVFITGNVMMCVSCSVAIACCHVLMFERKRARKFARKRQETERKPIPRKDKFLEKLLHRRSSIEENTVVKNSKATVGSRATPGAKKWNSQEPPLENRFDAFLEEFQYGSETSSIEANPSGAAEEIKAKSSQTESPIESGESGKESGPVIHISHHKGKPEEAVEGSKNSAGVLIITQEREATQDSN